MQLPMMIGATAPAPAARPHIVYKRQLLDEVLAFRPTTLLDVGCGSGDFLMAARDAGVESVVGLEPEPGARELALSRQLEVVAGRAEAIPFPDLSFDIVTLDYVAHHTESLPKALREAARIARRAVLILDCWFDDAIPSQRVARRYDEWLKRLDRKAGYVHNSCPTAAELIGMLAAEDLAVDYSYRLILSPLDVDQVEQSAKKRMAEAPDASAGLELESILDDARRNGISDDGCIVARMFRGSHKQRLGL